MALDTPAQPTRKDGTLEASQKISLNDLRTYEASARQSGKAPKAELTPKEGLELRRLLDTEMAAYAKDTDGRTTPGNEHLTGNERKRFDELMERGKLSKAFRGENTSQQAISKDDLDKYAQTLSLSGLKSLFSRCVDKDQAEFDVDKMRKEIKSEGLKPENSALMAALDALEAKGFKQGVRPVDLAAVYNEVAFSKSGPMISNGTRAGQSNQTKSSRADAPANGTNDGSLGIPGIEEVIKPLNRMNNLLERRLNESIGKP